MFSSAAENPTHEVLSRLHFITWDDEKTSHAHMTEEACKGGVKLVQLRTKGRDFATWLSLAREVKAVCDAYAAKLIVNDNVAIAKAVNAFGVHLGKNDMPISAARTELGPDYIIGGTANSADDVAKLIKLGADYIGIGPFRFTSTKKELSPVLGIGGIAELVGVATSERSDVPLIAIGGIEQADILPLMNTGIYGIAVSGAVARAASIRNSAARFVEALKGSV